MSSSLADLVLTVRSTVLYLALTNDLQDLDILDTFYWL